jgi:hypothetical protein
MLLTVTGRKEKLSKVLHKLVLKKSVRLEKGTIINLVKVAPVWALNSSSKLDLIANFFVH